MSWEDRAVCRNRPADWWETGDSGNRLAMTFCRLACPVLAKCAAADPSPVGMVRAGVAYSQTGVAHAVCACGRPVIQPARPGWCRTCRPAEVRIQLPTVARPRGKSTGRPVLYPCGTWQAYQRHVRRREPTDEACRTAHRILHRQQDAARRDARRNGFPPEPGSGSVADRQTPSSGRSDGTATDPSIPALAAAA